MRTWTVNGKEMLKVVYEAELDDVLLPPTEDDVGRVAACRNENTMNDQPLQIDAVGTILYVAPEDEEVELEPDKKTGKHPDGKYGEVFVLYAHLRKKIPEEELAGWLVCLFFYTHLSFAF